ncbi:uncharacterized protein [Magallana gigas]|uniref:uncharacterized protein n=1 Tax=Magallana gigas TaxID=29159 RepID=UPI00333FA8DC
MIVFRMIALLWTLFVTFHGYGFCYENLSRRPTTVLTQSSTYNAQTASIANDGDVQTDELHCSHTAHNHTKAWLQVDFGQPFMINNVIIHYRREGDESSSWKQYRFRQFYLDASNNSAIQTTTSQRTRCYTDNTTAPDLPPNIIDIPCKQTARYVIVETTYDAPEDDYLDEHGAILEICEIKVYGCGKTNGICIKGCTPGQHGDTCDETCSHGCAGGTCDQQKGTCSAGCKQNWTGRLCDVCDAKHYGTACSMKCNINCLNNTCNDVTGSCKDGCVFGKFGDFCNETCDEHCVSFWHEDTEKYKKLKESNLETLFILNGMIAALCVSLIVNGCMIKWNLRRDQYKGQDVNQNTMNKNVPLQDSISPQDMYDTVGDDTKYEDLGQLSGSPHYDQLELIKPS